jgi:hypothetical protein
LPPIRTVAELETRLAEAERKIDAALAYDAAENLVNAYGYFADESMWNQARDLFTGSPSTEVARELADLRARSGEKPGDSLTVRQMLQPVIHVASDAKSAKIRVRLLEIDQGANGRGEWVSGAYESEAVRVGDSWKLGVMNLSGTWRAGYRDGWARATSLTKASAASPFHYKNPVTGR